MGGWDGYDNGALHIHLLRTLLPQAIGSPAFDVLFLLSFRVEVRSSVVNSCVTPPQISTRTFNTSGV